MSTDITAASNAAKLEHPHLLSFDIPALSFAAGGTKIDDKLGLLIDDDHKVNMNNAFKRDGWPTAHLDKDKNPAWFHSDFKDVAYLYTSKLYKHMVDEGNLK